MSPHKEKIKSTTRSEFRSKNTCVPANSCLLIIHSSKHCLADASVATGAGKVKNLLVVSGRREKPSLFVAGNGVDSSQCLQVNLTWWRLRQWFDSAGWFTGMQTGPVSSQTCLEKFYLLLARSSLMFLINNKCGHSDHEARRRQPIFKHHSNFIAI